MAENKRTRQKDVSRFFMAAHATGRRQVRANAVFQRQRERRGTNLVSERTGSKRSRSSWNDAVDSTLRPFNGKLGALGQNPISRTLASQAHPRAAARGEFGNRSDLKAVHASLPPIFGAVAPRCRCLTGDGH